jgi:hypothetical protein
MFPEFEGSPCLGATCEKGFPPIIAIDLLEVEKIPGPEIETDMWSLMSQNRSQNRILYFR